ncbi:MAG: peptidoglycan-binding protein, partial [Candidatus Magasanikbacteria bacterium]
MTDDLLKKAAIFGLSIVTAIGLSGAAFAAPSTAQAASLTDSQINSIVSLLKSFNADQSTISDVEASLRGKSTGGGDSNTGGTTDMVECNFNRDLYVGRSGSDVKCLQRYLNDAGFTLAESGPGSPGNETDYFGSITKSAVVEWQNAHSKQVLQPAGLSSGTGYWGSSSIDYYNKLLAQSKKTSDKDKDKDKKDKKDEEDKDVAKKSGWSVKNLHDPMMDTVETVPQGAQGVEFLKVEVKAHESGTLESLTLDRRGVGQPSDFGDAYVFMNDTRFTSARSMNSNNGEIEFSNLDMEVEKGQKVEFSVLANISSNANAGNTNYLKVVNAQGEGFDASVLEGMRGVKYDTANSSAGNLTFSSSGSLSNPALGEQDIRLGKFQIDSVDNEDTSIDRIILEQNGSVDADGVSNLKLEDASGNVVATTDKIQSVSSNNELATFTFDESFEIEEGESETFTLRGSITSAADNGDTVQFQLEEAVDLKAVGEDFGYGVTVNAGSGAYPEQLQSLTIQGGDVTFTFDDTPSTQSVQVGGDNVSLLDFTVTAEQFTEMDTIPVTFDELNGDGGGTGTGDNGGLLNTDGNGNLQDLRIVDQDTGETVMGPDSLDTSSSGSDDSQTINFNDVWFMDADETRHLSIQADINQNASSSQEYQATLALGNNNLTIEDVNGDSITSQVIPQSNISGNTQTTASADLNVSLSSNPSSATLISGSRDVDALGLRFEAGDASKITLTNLTLQVYSDGNTSGNLATDGSGTGDNNAAPQEIVSSLKLVGPNGNQVGSVQGVNSSGQATFDEVDFKISSGGVKTLTVVADVSTNAPFGSSNDRFSIDIANTGDVTAEDNDGDTVSLSSANPNGSTSPTVVHTVQSSGTLSVSANGNTPDSGIVMAGTDKVPFLSVDFSSVFENFEIQKFRLESNVAGTSDEFGSIWVYDSGGNLLTSGSLDQNGQWQASDESNGLFTVSKEGTTVSFKADVAAHNETSNSGADTGAQPRLRLKLSSSTNNGTTYFKAVGESSGSVLSGTSSLSSGLTVSENVSTANMNVVTGDQMVIRRAEPKITKNDLSSTLDSTSNQKLIDFNIASKSGGDDVSIKSLVFSINMSDSGTDNSNNLSLQDFRWYEGGSEETSNVTITHAASGTVPLATDVSDGSGNSITQTDSTSGDHVVVVTYNNSQELEISAGSSQDVSLRANPNSVDNGDDSISVKLLNDGTAHSITGNYHDYFVGETTVDSQVYVAPSGATATSSSYVAFYDVDGNNNWNSGTDVQLAGSSTPSDGTTGSVASSTEVVSATSTRYLYTDLGSDTTTSTVDSDDIVFATTTQHGTSSPGSADLDRVADGDNISIYYEL